MYSQVRDRRHHLWWCRAFLQPASRHRRSHHCARRSPTAIHKTYSLSFYPTDSANTDKTHGSYKMKVKWHLIGYTSISRQPQHKTGLFKKLSIIYKHLEFHITTQYWITQLTVQDTNVSQTFKLFTLSRCLVTYYSHTVNNSWISYIPVPFSLLLEISGTSSIIILYYNTCSDFHSFTNIAVP